MYRCPLCPTTTATGRTSIIGLPRPTGPRLHDFNLCLAERNQDRLEAEGGGLHHVHAFRQRLYPGGQGGAAVRAAHTAAGRQERLVRPGGTLLDHLLSVPRTPSHHARRKGTAGSEVADVEAVRGHELSAAEGHVFRIALDPLCILTLSTTGKQLTAAVAAFNRRLVGRRAVAVVPALPVPEWLPRLPGQKALPGILRGRRRRGASPRRLHAQAPGVPHRAARPSPSAISSCRSPRGSSTGPTPPWRAASLARASGGSPCSTAWAWGR